MISAVIDPSVLISALIGRPDAGPGQVVAAWRDGRFTLIVSPLLLAELAEVLARPKFARWAGRERGSAYVAAFAARSDHRPDPRRHPEQRARSRRRLPHRARQDGPR